MQRRRGREADGRLDPEGRPQGMARVAAGVPALDDGFVVLGGGEVGLQEVQGAGPNAVVLVGEDDEVPFLEAELGLEVGGGPDNGVGDAQGRERALGPGLGCGSNRRRRPGPWRSPGG